MLAIFLCLTFHNRLVVIHTLCLLFLLLNHRPVAGGDDFVIAAYLPEYRAYINVNKTAPYLTDLILFSTSPDANGDLGPCCLEPHHFNQAREARAFKRKEFPDEKPLKLWLSVGGAGRSSFFPLIASDRTLRRKFIRGLRQKVEMEKLDGVDFDWEAPQSQEEYQSYMHLIQEASKELLDQAGILVSVALHPRQVFPPGFYDHVSRINLMTYDMVDGTGGSHASMDKMKAAIQLLDNAQCPKSQIVVGVPAYARHGRNPGQVKTYSEVVDAIVQSEPNVDPNSVARRSNYEGFLFDSPWDVRKKVDLAVKAGHAGVFFWELGQDKQHDEWAPGGMLLEAAADQARKSRKTKSSSSSAGAADEL